MQLAQKNIQSEKRPGQGFTLIEVMIALAVTLIALLPLLHLLTSSILTTNAAQNLTTATLIASEKLAELTSQTDPEKSALPETIENPNTQTIFTCQKEISPAEIPELDDAPPTNLYKASITLNWYEGSKQKQTQISKYIFIDTPKK
jgi:type II secretion system protein I